MTTHYIFDTSLFVYQAPAETREEAETIIVTMRLVNKIRENPDMTGEEFEQCREDTKAALSSGKCRVFCS